MAIDRVELMTEAPVTGRRVMSTAVAGFVLVVGLVLLAAYFGYEGSSDILRASRRLIQENLLRGQVGAQVEGQIVQETKELVQRLNLVLGLCLILAVATAGLTLWMLGRAFSRLEWQAAELNRVSWHLLDGHEKMARRFSHEMHDELGQSLSGLRRMLNRMDATEFAARRGECVSIVDEVLESVRKLSHALRPVVLDDLGLDAGIRWLCERFEKRTGIRVDFESNLTRRLSEAEETHLFRLVQEALTNVARHAEATSVRVVILQNASRIQLVIEDNGRGMKSGNLGREEGLGLVGMRARARQLGGELEIGNRRDGGVKIRVEVPAKHHA